MSYVKLDDGFFRNPKARRLGKDGRALYLAGLCHCSGEMTDGFIDGHMVAILLLEAEVRTATVTLLVKLGAWTVEDDGYRVHDYLKHQTSRSQVEAKRAKWRRAKWRSPTDSTVESNGHSASESASASVVGSRDTETETETEESY